MDKGTAERTRLAILGSGCRYTCALVKGPPAALCHSLVCHAALIAALCHSLVCHAALIATRAQPSCLSRSFYCNTRTAILSVTQLLLHHAHSHLVCHAALIAALCHSLVCHAALIATRAQPSCLSRSSNCNTRTAMMDDTVTHSRAHSHR
jgi:F0F1-type ATP synthase membrane subunit c/vacuolar-type H+-ATPase subunit K